MQPFPSMHERRRTLKTLIMLHSSLDPLYLTASSNALNGGKLIKFHADADNFHLYETSRPKRALAQVEMTFSWIIEHDGYMKSHVRS
jgi:hypothetical protein